LAKVFLKKNEDKRIRQGHLWVFSNEIAKSDKDIETGDIVTLYDAGGQILGRGFYNKSSLIAVRLLSKNYKESFDDYAELTITQALKLRKELYPNRNSYRLIFSESDFMPGLIVDKYNETYVMQVYSAGMQKNIESVINVLKDKLGAKNIFTANEPYFRKLEGLSEEDNVYLGEAGKEIIDDGKLKYEINFSNSQKTGFYFDQCDNREFTEKFTNKKTVLDAFCNSGGFGLHAAYAGAGFVTFVDSSKTEIENAQRNFISNSLKSETEFTVSDIFVFLEKCVDAGRTFNVVMADPPAFAKSRKSIPTALKGYIKLNKLALSCVSKGGYLVTSSCSHHIKQEDFIDCINTAAAKSEKQIQLVHYNSASLDHPQLPAMVETTYLKFAVFKVS
jgi:23S rRNA (cytosine1962-C5)-methyltransferase